MTDRDRLREAYEEGLAHYDQRHRKTRRMTDSDRLREAHEWAENRAHEALAHYERLRRTQAPLTQIADAAGQHTAYQHTATKLHQLHNAQKETDQ